MKRIAIRGLIILTLVVVFSMFFAQTLITITTPKIKITTAKKGLLEYKVPLIGGIAFETTQEFTPEEIQQKTITINRVLVKIGDWVEVGQVIAEALPPEDSAIEINEARRRFRLAQTAYLQNETDFPTLAKNTESDKNNVIREAEDALYHLMAAQEALIEAAAAKDVLLGTDIDTWASTAQANGDAELIALVKTVQDAQTAVNTAQQQYIEVFSTSKTKKELVQFIENRVALRRDVEGCQTGLLHLLERTERMKTIRAPHAGYVVELNLEAGKTYDGSMAAAVFSVNSEPLIKCDISGIGPKLEAGMKVEIQGGIGIIHSEVYGVVNSGYQKKDLFITLTQETLSQLGGLHTLLKAKPKIPATVLYRAEKPTTLLPASAVRTEDQDNSFVYVIEQGTGFWGITLSLRKQNVTVMERGEKDIALVEDLGSMKIADKEDRAIKDGITVMEYVN